MDPIHQFQIKTLFPIMRIGATEIAFTNSALFMLIGLTVILLFMLGATRSRSVLLRRLQRCHAAGEGGADQAVDGAGLGDNEREREATEAARG